MRISDRASSERYIAQYPVERMFSFPIRRNLSVHAISKGEYLFRSDEAVNRLYFLVEGRAKTYIVHLNGNESILAFPGPGTIMGDMELVGSVTESYMVQAIEPCIAIELNLRGCREQVLGDAKFLLLLCRLMGNKLYRKDTHLSAVKSFTLKSKLAEFILLTQTDGIFAEPLTQTAQYLGVSYRHLQRAMAAFCKSGIVTRENKKYLISDKEMLEELVGDICSETREEQGFLKFIRQTGIGV
ncbi:MAG: transcriptional regulator YeiL [Clostridiaceae bacterium]|nr:transcriptional regulator YeiL [Eubacteriales bacterium]